MKPLPYGRQDVTEEDVREVLDCLASDFLTQGPRVPAFEEALCAETGARFAVAVSSATAGLHLAALALGVGPGDVGVTTPITFAASANALRYAGAAVCFADVDPATGLLSEDALERRCEALVREGRAPRVLVPVDFAGQPVDYARVRDIADRVGARVLADAAHSVGGAYTHGGRRIRVGEGVHADATVLSFHPVKQITTAEGGAVLTNDPELARRLRELRTHGIHRVPERFSRPPSDPFVGPWYYEQETLGFNYRLTDLQCALGTSQLRRLGAYVARRRELARRYDAVFTRAPFAGRVVGLSVHPGRESGHHLYVLRLVARAGEPRASVAARRRALFEVLHARDIRVQVHYVPVPWHPFHREACTPEEVELPGAADFYAGCLSLPLFPTLGDEDQDRVLTALAEGLERA